MAACGEEDFFRADGLLCAVIKNDFGFGFGEEVSPAVEVFDFVVEEIFFVDAVQPFDVGVSFALEGSEVEGGGFFDVEAVGCGFVESFGDGGGVPGDFFGHAADVDTGTA